MIGYFLDDERDPSNVYWVDYPNNVNWLVFRNLKEFMDVVKNTKNFDDIVVSLDHDIADFDDTGKEVTGYDAVKEMVDHFLDVGENKPPLLLVHTQNPIGKANIVNYWNSYLRSIS